MSRVCIFDIDNTLTHGKAASNKLCCPSNNPCCLLNSPQFQPNWPESGSGTSDAVLDTIKKCREKGYDIAIATAESGMEALNKKQRNFIKNIVGENIVDTPMFQNACTAQGVYHVDCSKNNHICCTTEYSDKTQMYTNIMNYKGVKPEEWHKSIVFDDAKSNLQTAHKMGFQTCQASPQCGGKYCDEGCGLMDDCLYKISGDTRPGIGIL